MAGGARAAEDLVPHARLAELIVAERAAGRAPEGADADALAACLVWTGERAFHVAMTGEIPMLSGHDALIEPLVQLYVGTIYRRPVRVATP